MEGLFEMTDATETKSRDESKLPKWARDELRSLRLKVDQQLNALMIAAGDANISGATGKVIADDLSSNGFPLNDHTNITFHVPGGRIYVRLRENGTLLDINGSQPFQILPRAANCAYIKIEERS